MPDTTPKTIFEAAFPMTAGPTSNVASGRLPDPIQTFTVGGPASVRPTVVCLCGSTAFPEAFRAANFRETLAGRIVLSIGVNMRTDGDLFVELGLYAPVRIKKDLDELHKRKIDLADEVLVLNVGGYVGSSTRSEIEYAQAHGKPIRWLEPTTSEE